MPATQTATASTPVSSTYPMRTGRIAVMIRMEPARFNRLKEVAHTLELTQQQILISAFDTKIGYYERRAHNIKPVPGQISLFPDIEAAQPEARPEPEKRDEGVIQVGYLATDSQYRWLKQQADRRGISMREVITGALHQAGMPA